MGSGPTARTWRITSSPSRSGNPRSRIIKSGFACATALSACAAFSAATIWKPSLSRLAFRKRWIAGSSSTIRILGLIGHGLLRRGLQGNPEQGTRSTGGAIGPVLRHDAAAHGFDEALADREAEPGAGAPPVADLDAEELVEDAFKVAGRNSRPLIQNLDRDALRGGARADAHRAVRRRV